MTITTSLVYVAVAGSLLYLVCSKGKTNTASSIPVAVPAPIHTAKGAAEPGRPSLLRTLDEQGVADAMNDPKYAPAAVNSTPPGPTDYNYINNLFKLLD